ncbi:Hypothetical predicted protein, partial [Marmota monax]
LATADGLTDVHTELIRGLGHSCPATRSPGRRALRLMLQGHSMVLIRRIPGTFV